MTFTDLHTDRLVLRRICIGDAEAVFAYRSLPEQAQWQPVERKTVEETRAFIEPFVSVEPDTPGTWLALAITFREGGRLIGDIGLRFPEKETWQAELGISLDPKYHRVGYGSEAMRAVMGYAFDVLGKHRVYASIDPRNKASMALVERLGFRREAHFILSIRWKGGWADDLIYGMLEEEWRAGRGKSNST
jgi:RimJ/RimL family protein N-acetyltransferase